MFKVHKNLSVAITRNLLSSDLSIVLPIATTGTNAYLGLKDWNIISIEVKDLLQERKFQILSSNGNPKIIVTGSMNSLYKITVSSISE